MPGFVLRAQDWLPGAGVNDFGRADNPQILSDGGRVVIQGLDMGQQRGLPGND